jgi:aryl carrier-like protein
MMRRVRDDGLPPAGRTAVTTGSSGPAAHQDPDAVLAQLDALVREILGRAIDPDVNYFSAGLDSLAVTKLHTLLTRRLDVRLPVMTLFRRPTLRGTAERVVAARAALARDEAAGRTAGPPARPEPVPGPGTAAPADGAASRREIRARIRRGEAPR